MFLELRKKFHVCQHVKEPKRKIAKTQLGNTTWRHLRASSWTIDSLPKNSRRYIFTVKNESYIIISGNNFNKNNKEPLELLGKISSRYERFMSEFISDRPNIIKSVTKQLGSLTTRMEKQYKKLNSKCKFLESSDVDADSER